VMAASSEGEEPWISGLLTEPSVLTEKRTITVPTIPALRQLGG
jgi:hypothetical protein